MIFLWYCSLLQ